MSQPSLPRIGIVSVMLAIAWLAGCETPERPSPLAEGPLDAAYQSVYDSKAYADTVASEAYYQGMRQLRVRGYGLVVGLGEKGSSECPDPIRDQLQKYLARAERDVGRHEDLGTLSIDTLIADRDTAVVEVIGDVPAGLAKGERFDVRVRALPGTQTSGLAGGWLYTCDLRLYRPDERGRVLEGKVIAHAAGPIFVNPFIGSEEGDEPASRSGLVLGGGINLEDRRLRLVLTTPSYSMARRVERRINNRFGSTPRVAEALSAGVVELHVPPAHRGREKYFAALVSHTFLYDSPAFLDRRARDLLEELQQSGAPYDDIVMACQGLGRTVLPGLRDLYVHRSRTVRFQAARAGLRLGDDLAINVVAEHARKSADPWREQAIRELGMSGKPAAGPPLRPLLDDPDQRIRIATYLALRELRDEAVETIVLGPRNVVLDLVDSAGPHLVYARRSIEPRLALFGRNMQCQPPIYYALRDFLVTVSAEAGADKLILTRRTPYRRLVSDPISISLRVADLVCRLAGEPTPDTEGKTEGLGLVYSQVLDVLEALCDQGSIGADFRLEGTVITDLWDQTPTIGRRESEF
jgi:flagellar basal body P-ring protein FlgI